mmetsp:Transcript_96734/g.276211  ORF Transcript_96734/g.276211 Transcript_96734/m.276211 type:complete len:229 (-) Transcript_96734:1647-2333(-)
MSGPRLAPLPAVPPPTTVTKYGESDNGAVNKDPAVSGAGLAEGDGGQTPGTNAVELAGVSRRGSRKLSRALSAFDVDKAVQDASEQREMEWSDLLVDACLSYPSVALAAIVISTPAALYVMGLAAAGPYLKKDCMHECWAPEVSSKVSEAGESMGRASYMWLQAGFWALKPWLSTPSGWFCVVSDTRPHARSRVPWWHGSLLPSVYGSIFTRAVTKFFGLSLICWGPT